MRLPKISNLYGKIFAIFWFTMFLVLIAVLVVQSSDPRQNHSIKKSDIQSLEGLANALEYEYKDAITVESIYKSIEHTRNYYGNKKYFIFFSDLDGNLVSKNSRTPYRMVQNFITSLETLNTPQQRLYGRLMVSGPMPIEIANKNFLLFVAKRWDQTPPFLLKLFESPIKLLLVVMLVSTPLLLWLAYALSQPARKLENAAKKVANGEFIEDPSLEKGSTEFKEAGAAFNKMVFAINQMMSGHQRLLSDISHELRSPLTRLRMANALAVRKQGDSSELARIEIEAERLEKMIGKLLELSCTQMNSHQIRGIHHASALWQEMITDAQFEAEQKNKILDYNPLPECTLIGNPSLLMSAIENVIRNAIYYSHSTIRISFKIKDKQLHICVEDDGDGVSDAELNNIFRPFYRTSTARDRSSGGSGLGLAITDSAIRQHNGSIQVSRSALNGLKITISLPILAES